jgi:diguanylate cyclase (GGDEF)-like protein
MRVESSIKRCWRAIDELQSAVLMHVGLDGDIQYVNSGITKLLGFRPEELIGESMTLFMPDMVRPVHERIFSDPDRYWPGMESTGVRQGRVDEQSDPVSKIAWHDRLRCMATHKNGRSMPVELTINEAWSEGGRRQGYLALILDGSEAYGLKEKLRRREIHDELTGLLCLRGFQVSVENRLENFGATGYCLIHLDIDHFSVLSFESPQVAKNAIRAFAAWLQVRLARLVGGEASLVCKHLNGTEFVIYLAETQCDRVMALARRLRSDFSRINLATDSRPFHTTLSMGLATDVDGAGLERILSRAANACYLARSRGGDRIVVADDKDLRIYRLAEQIREALLGERIEVHAQKIIPIGKSQSPDQGLPLHMEVLCRMRDDAGNLVMPDRIFPAAEPLGLARLLDIHLIRKTLNLLVRYSDSQDWLARCSFNLSGITLSREDTFLEIRSLIEQSGIAAEKLCFEMTESAAIRDSQSVQANLFSLRDLGCRIAIDDFGRGYSNYQSLASWPIDIVKIDGSYIRELIDNPSLRIDTQGMIASARTRGMDVVAEYVESEEIVRELIRLGADFAQGYWFHRPEPIGELLVSLDV